MNCCCTWRCYQASVLLLETYFLRTSWLPVPLLRVRLGLLPLALVVMLLVVMNGVAMHAKAATLFGHCSVTIHCAQSRWIWLFTESEIQSKYDHARKANSAPQMLSRRCGG